jgi:hypothetical protein
MMITHHAPQPRAFVGNFRYSPSGPFRGKTARAAPCFDLAELASPFLAILPTGAGPNRGKITVKAVFACTFAGQPWSNCQGRVGLLVRLDCRRPFMRVEVWMS